MTRNTTARAGNEMSHDRCRAQAIGQSVDEHMKDQQPRHCWQHHLTTERNHELDKNYHSKSSDKSRVVTWNLYCTSVSMNAMALCSGESAASAQAATKSFVTQLRNTAVKAATVALWTSCYAHKTDATDQCDYPQERKHEHVAVTPRPKREQ